MSLMTAMADERLISGCVGADRPEAQPYIPEVDGVLYSTCPERRRRWRNSSFRRGNGAPLGRTTRPSLLT
jgi:hypothetical protein